MNYCKADNVSNAVNETNDCAVKAVAIACDVAYRVAHRALANEGRRNRAGTYTSQINKAIRSLGYDLARTEVNAKTVATLDSDANVASGHYVAYVRGHILAIKDGRIEDWSQGSRRRILSVHRVYPTATRKQRKELAKQVFSK